MSVKSKKESEKFHTGDWRENLEKFKKERAEFAEKMKIEREQWWQKNLPRAYGKALRNLGETYPCNLEDLRFGHVDENGYYFEYSLIGDSNKSEPRIYFIRHVEVR